MSKRQWTKEEISAFRKKHGSIFYVNPEDANLFIPREFGLGWSLNFANPISWLIVVALIGLIVASFFFD